MIKDENCKLHSLLKIRCHEFSISKNLFYDTNTVLVEDNAPERYTE